MANTNTEKNDPIFTQSATDLVATPAQQPPTPCSMTAIGPTISGASLGFLFGSVSTAFNRLAAFVQRRPASTPFLQDAWKSGSASAKTFAIMSGVYALSACVVLRVRQTEDAVNGATAGCVTGIALAWGGGPQNCLQSCLLVGGFSYVMERFGNTTAQATQLCTSAATTAAQRFGRRKRTGRHTQGVGAVVYLRDAIIVPDHGFLELR